MAGYREEKGELRLDGLDGGCGETGSVVQRATLVARGRKEEEAIKAARWPGGGGRSVMAIFGMWVTHKPRLVP